MENPAVISKKNVTNQACRKIGHNYWFSVQRLLNTRIGNQRKLILAADTLLGQFSEFVMCANVINHRKTLRSSACSHH